MKIIKNYMYNVFYQLLAVCIPFLTIPYVSRILGSANIGINSFTAANTQYFVLLATMGISVYATREVAYLKDNVVARSRLFIEIMTVKIVLFLLSYLLFLVFVSSVHAYKSIYFIQSISILASLFDVSWFFMGLQNFKVTVLRNTIVKLITVVAIFLFIKTDQDLYKYIIILVASNLFGNVTLWTYLYRNITFVSFRKLMPLNHIKPIMVLFIPQIAIQVFTVVNKTILGIYSTPENLGLFENADKIIRVIMAIVTASGMVLLPAISQFFIIKDYDKVRTYMYKGFDYISFISIPLSIGLISISDKFGAWFFGSSFTNIGAVLSLLSTVLVFMAWNNTFSSQFLIPAKHENWYTQSFVYGAILNVILNIILDRNMGAVGAAISAVIAETFVVLYQISKIRYFFSIKILFRHIWKYYVSAIIMGILIFTLNMNYQFSIVILILDMVMGIIVYLVCTFCLHVPILQDAKDYVLEKYRK